MLRSPCTYLVSCLLFLAACSGGGGGGAPANVATLSSLLVSTGTLTPAFNRDVLAYTVDVATSVSSVSIAAAGLDDRATVSVDGQLLVGGAASAPIALVEGPNVLSISVTAADAVTIRTYTVTVTRQAAPTLSGLTVSGGTLSPAFDAQTTAYTVTAGFLMRSVSVTASTDPAGNSLTVNGTAVTSGEASAMLALSEGANAITVRVTNANAEVRDYVITVTQQALSQFAQQAYAKASNTDVVDLFGWSVALSGDTMAIGAFGEDSDATGINGDQNNNSATDSGAVYVFTRTGTGTGSTWSQQAYIKASNTQQFDRFGISVALSGDTLAVGADGEDSNATGINGNQGNNSDDFSGAVYVFTRTGTNWSQQAYIKASNTNALDNFGISVALSSDTLAVGADGESSNAIGINGNPTLYNRFYSGAVYVFTRTGTSWIQQAYIKASNNDSGDRFGNQVALSGGTLAASAIEESSNATGINGNQNDNSAFLSGAAYVFTRAGTTWSQQAYVKASNTDTGDSFGTSIALSGDTMAVGSDSEDSNAAGINGTQTDNSASGSGAAYVFTRTGTSWSQQAYVKASNNGGPGSWANNAKFGISIALSGDTLAVGAIFEANNATGINSNQSSVPAGGAGAAYVFTRIGTTWSQDAYIKGSNTEGGDELGISIALSPDTLAVGASREDSNATGINGNQADNSVPTSGAVYVFR